GGEGAEALHRFPVRGGDGRRPERPRHHSVHPRAASSSASERV
ncbi:MAG: hypothetical protein AVDCRST_MAG04-2811, partial [uncultured Acetobacteraceae bacterium]